MTLITHFLRENKYIFSSILLFVFIVENIINFGNCIDGKYYGKEEAITRLNPCEDFYKFSCNNWISKSKRPPFEILWNYWHEASHILNANIRSILDRQKLITNQSLKKARMMYLTCLNAANIDRTDELVLLCDALGGWPLSQNDSIVTNYKWPGKIAQLTRFIKIHPLLKVHVDVNFKNISKHILYIDPGDLVMPSYILEEPQNHIQELVKYKDWIANTVKLMYPYKTTLPNLNSEIDDLITLEIQLAKLVSHNHDRQITTIAALIDQVPNIDWIQLFKILFDGTDISLTENDSVAISILYIKSIVNLLKETKPKTTANFVMWHLVKELSRDASPTLKYLNFRINNAILGVEEDYPVYYECAAKTAEFFQFAIAEKYSELFLKRETFAEVRRMAAEIKSEFLTLLKRNQWLSKSVLKKAIKKIATVKVWIGYPTWLRNSTALDQFYRNIKIINNHLINILHLRQHFAKYNIQNVLSPATNRWPSNLFDTNGYYNQLQNVIIISIGLLGKPFFALGNPSASNYGGLGSLIGHELSHALDTIAKEHKDLWGESDFLKYMSRIDCFKEHYNNYNVNSQQTLVENIADNVGLELSFRAYHRNRILNGSKTNSEFQKKYAETQLFFTSYAQIWCEIHENNDEFLIEEEHAPVQFRVQGAVRNSMYFHQSFYCDLGNTKELCRLW